MLPSCKKCSGKGYIPDAATLMNEVCSRCTGTGKETINLKPRPERVEFNFIPAPHSQCVERLSRGPLSESFAIKEAPLMFKYGSFWPIIHITDSVDSANEFIQSVSMNLCGLTGVIRETDELIFVAPFQAVNPF